jgi:2-polyprenyl-6-methoxyphenol hydroxylase-like FAD-dependent oxidoreductase
VHTTFTRAHDVIIVGARCGGAFLGALLAKQGLNVLIVDKAHQLDNIDSTHILQLNGAGVLARHGLDEALLATGAPPLTGMTVSIDGVDLSCDYPPHLDDGPGAFCVRRDSLDGVLARYAESCGATVELGVKATRVVCTDAGVRGVRLQNVDSGRVSYASASLVVGADGRRSRIAQEVGARQYNTVHGERFVLWTYARRPVDSTPKVAFIRHNDSIILHAPTDEHRLMVALNPPLENLKAARRNPHGYLVSELARCPETKSLSAALEHEPTPTRIVGRSMSYFREVAGPGWLLAGDAAMYKDPCTGQGMSDALRHAESLAPVVRKGLECNDLEKRLRAWWRWRDRDESTSYGFFTLQGRTAGTSDYERDLLHRFAADDARRVALAAVFAHKKVPAFTFGSSASRVLLSQLFASPARGMSSSIDAGRILANEVKWWSKLQASAAYMTRLERSRSAQ